MAVRSFGSTDFQFGGILIYFAISWIYLPLKNVSNDFRDVEYNAGRVFLLIKAVLLIPLLYPIWCRWTVPLTFRGPLLHFQLFITHQDTNGPYKFV